MANQFDNTIDRFSQLSINSVGKIELDPTWLIPHETKQGYVFHCSLTLKQLIEQKLAEIFFRKLLKIIEEEKEMVDFHMKLHLENQCNLGVDIICKNNQPRSGPISAEICISCDTDNQLSKLSLLRENSTTRIWLDGQLREKIIVTPVKHIERLSDLSEEEMFAFWNDTQMFLNQENCYWQSIILNHGNYRTHPHLHMKINIHPALWNQRIRKKYKEKLRAMDQLLNHGQPNVTRTYFGDRQFNQWSRIKRDNSKN